MVRCPERHEHWKKESESNMSRLKGQALIEAITQQYIKEVPTFSPGDTVKVYVKRSEEHTSELQSR